MQSGELSFDFPSLHVTWTIPDFFELYTESGYSLQSPDFAFADGRYCLWFFEELGCGEDCIGIEVLNLIGNVPGRAVLYEVQFKSSTREIDIRCDIYGKRTFWFSRREIEGKRDLYVPDGTLTVLCSLRPRKSRGAGSTYYGGAQTRVIPHSIMGGTLSSQSPPSLSVTWRIPGFFQISQKSGCTLESCEFPFSDNRYRLRLSWIRYNLEEVRIELLNLSDAVPRRYVSYDLVLKSTSGEEIDMNRRGTSTTRKFFIARCHLDRKKSECFPDGHLTVFCCMESVEPSSAGSPKSGMAETAGSKVPVPQAAACPKSGGVQTSNADGDKEGLPGVEKLQSDYKRLLLKGFESDACLVVCGKEFQAHRNVLRARSPVFEAMFDHETAEKASGRVVIDDLKPDRFQDFMEYLYTGRVESFSDDNAFNLYAAADKYDVPTLKSECVEYMRRSLTVDNFCDVVALALRHHEKDLLELAVEFFKKNVAGIILTVKWQQFMSENSTRANELFIKLHVPGKESDKAL